jgi:hypothetical protein
MVFAFCYHRKVRLEIISLKCRRAAFRAWETITSSVLHQRAHSRHSKSKLNAPPSAPATVSRTINSPFIACGGAWRRGKVWRMRHLIIPTLQLTLNGISKRWRDEVGNNFLSENRCTLEWIRSQSTFIYSSKRLTNRKVPESLWHHKHRTRLVAKGTVTGNVEGQSAWTFFFFIC